MKFVFIDTQSNPKNDFTIIKNIMEKNGIEYDDAKLNNENEIIEYVKDVDGFGLTFPIINERIINSLTNCKVIVRNGVGFDNVDIPAATKKGIAVCNVPNFCSDEVATHALALILDAQRKITLHDRNARKGIWDAVYGHEVHRLSNQTLGIISFGNIARKLCSFCCGLGMKIIFYDPYISASEIDGAKKVELDELFNQSDIISLHCPCTEETRHIINDSSIANMKDGVIIVNTSRGPLIELDSLVNALDSGKVAAAGLDVFEGEPITDLTNKMYECENLIITPHSAYYSREAATDQMTILANTAVSVLKGSLPKNCLNREAL